MHARWSRWLKLLLITSISKVHLLWSVGLLIFKLVRSAALVVSPVIDLGGAFGVARVATRNDDEVGVERAVAGAAP